jgi:hypothetical protein
MSGSFPQDAHFAGLGVGSWRVHVHVRACACGHVRVRVCMVQVRPYQRAYLCAALAEPWRH